MTTMKKILPLILLLLCGTQAQAQQQTTASEVVYYGFDPDIVTNYVTANQRRLGYIRVTVELMLPDQKYLKTIEHHEPLILDAVIHVLNKQPEDKIKSLTGREEIRKNILEQVQQLLRRETGETVIKDLLFTKYLYQ